MIISIYKLGSSFGRPLRIIDQFKIDSNILGEKWCSFFIKTNFCRIKMWNKKINNTVRIKYNGLIYIITSNNRTIIYNTNYEIDDVIYVYVKDFVEYILDKYKYKRINNDNYYQWFQ